jgi:serine/threonine protein kinase
MSGIIHGDLKPNNILVSRDYNGEYTARVADFGCSTVAIGDLLIQVSTTPSWADPNYQGMPVSFDVAKLLDSFSFGRVCLWIFRSLAILQDSREVAHSQMVFLEDDYASSGIEGLLGSIHGLTQSQRQELSQLIYGTLQADIKQRMCDFRKFASVLGPDETCSLELSRITLHKNQTVLNPLFRVSLSAAISPKITELNLASLRTRLILC